MIGFKANKLELRTFTNHQRMKGNIEFHNQLACFNYAKKIIIEK